MRRIRQVQWWATWLLAILFLYLTLAVWAEAAVRLWDVRASRPWGPWVTVFVAFFTLAAVGVRSRAYRILAAAAALGLAAQFHPRLVFPALPALALACWIAQAVSDRRATRLGRTRWLPCPVRLTLADRLLHLHVLGPTGSGKSSSVLMPLIAQDLQRGYGVFVLEPKGDLALSAYRRAVREGRRIVRFNPLEPDCPHYNPLAGPAEAAAEGLALALSQLSDAGHPYYQTAARVQLLYGVRALKSALGDQADVGALLQFFRDISFQKEVVLRQPDAFVRQYFQEQWARTASHTREERQGLLYRLELLWANPALSRVLSAPHDFLWDDMLQASWVVLAPLSLAELGASARALGILLWHGLAQATYRRRPEAPNPPFFVYLDEFQEWVSEDLSHFLALARGFGVGLTLAHQDLGQLSPALTEAVLANARQRVILPGTAAEDIQRIQLGFAPYPPPSAIRYLPQGYAVVQLTHRGRLEPPRLVRLPHFPLGGSS
ncbi:MAG: type IV secretion system DNA-binding domain-containing protein [Firmicutes bacterium]|nr:type IV secretion system DNA-binding domain-containing protein [Bacillota bacterium]